MIRITYCISSINRPGLLFFEEGWTPGLLFGHGPLFEHGPLYFHWHIAGNGGFLTRDNNYRSSIIMTC